ncbi:extracellular matrix protein FRAS1-like isoform X1 [Anguilla anguilla]|uniref:extracellular matrix protein FRAS1-like isoform X1 n=2 Tax=Anguilla anguilla TaxID=7936 RepID=UPI0015A96E13|nr:extracellular matrix protein FRAS1-like isoform X1 [Anguilla anguilla]
MGFTSIWIFLAGIVNIPRGIDGACLYQGSLFENNALWKLDSCQDCSCLSDVVICKTTRCPVLWCDSQKGRRLRISPNKCCPECAPQTQGSCLHEGTTYGHGSQWSGSNCSVCICTQGKVSCAPHPCTPLHCGRGEKRVTRFGECCPKCTHSGASCFEEGQEYRDGEEWQPTSCTKCVCSGGEPQCFAVQCLPAVCQPHETVVIRRGECCPLCVPGACRAAGNKYKHGQRWHGENCTTCLCDQGQAHCHTETCSKSSCEKGQDEVQQVGHCCEDCMPSGKSCLHESVARNHGETWSMGCRFCACQQGQVLCQQAECGAVECSWGEELVHLLGKCCPECIRRRRSCVYKNQSKEDREKWWEGACRWCECRDSKVTCYHRLCPTCPVGTLAMYVEGRCCPECQEVQCHPDCLMCSRTPGHCDSCKDPHSVLHHGHCLQSCPQGFFQNGRTCAACKDSCGSCENDFECTSCSTSLLMSNRRCVSECESGFFVNHTQCARCHDSCTTCHGPSQSDCLSCSDPSHLLKDGLCTPECGTGFYARQGTCHACDKSCTTCYPDNPSCVSCPPDTALHDGKCVLHCPEQHYKDAHGRCRGCHPSCYSCNGPQRSDCTCCLNPEGVLSPHSNGVIHSTYISGCKDHFYLASDKFCRECHTSCLQCTGSSSMNCTSCPSLSILHRGQCLHRCPQGYYRQANFCNECHPSCKECSGPSEVDCSACLPHSSLYEGQCQTSCLEGQYPNTEGHCTECQVGCQRCVARPENNESMCLRCMGPRDLALWDRCVLHCPSGFFAQNGACNKCHWSCESCSDEEPFSCTSCPVPLFLSLGGLCVSQCLIGHYPNEKRVCQECDWRCSSCRGPLRTDCLQCMEGYVLQDGACNHGCSVGYYQDGEQCLSCDAHCVVCEGPGLCLTCERPLVLFQGLCVQECGRRFFLDTPRHQCTACPPDCVACDDPENCTTCRQNTFLKDGLCTTDCGHGFFANARSRTCQVNAHAPVLRTKGPLVVKIGGITLLDLSVVSAEDPDSSREDMLFQLVLPPSNGMLMRLTDGTETTLNREDSFTFGELRNGAVRFTHSKEKSKSGQLILRAADSQLFSPRVTINIQAVSLQPPYVLRNQPLVVTRGDAVVITQSELWIEDDDNPQDVVVRVLDPPQKGDLRHIHNKQLLRKFGLQELVREQLQYVHDGSSHTHDRALLLVSDGYGYQCLLFRINVMQKLDYTPHLLSFSTAWVKEGRMVQISQRHLWAVCRDSSQSQILYTIVTSQENPKYGKVVLLVPMPAEKLTEEWQRLADGRVARPAKSFTQQNISEGTVWYQHSGIGPERDTFQFQVSIEGSQEMVSNVYTFTIRVLPQSPIFSQLSPDSSLQMTALKDNMTGIRPSTLSFINKEAPNKSMVYSITRPLAQEQGTIEHLDRPYTPVESFTQADINEGRILYRPSSVPSHLQEICQFSFAVTDGEHTTPEMDFVIFLLADPQQPPVFRILHSVLEVHPGSRAAVSEQQLAVTDGDTALDELEFKLVEAPLRGLLWKLDGGTEREMLIGDTFTFSDITENTLQYERVGGATTGDLMLFSVTDGASVATATVQVLASGLRGDGPQLDPHAHLSIEVPEKSSITLRRTHLAYVDDDSPDDMIRIQLVSVPMYGTLNRTTPSSHLEELRELSVFTMDDINCHMIRYTAPSEVANLPVRDMFHFTVYNQRNNSLDNQIFTITITSAQKQPQGVMLHSLFKVQEGGRVKLSVSNITLRHSNTAMEDWLVRLASPPKYGFIENTGEAGVSGRARVISPGVPFPMDDLASDRIFYVPNINLSAAHCQDELSFNISDGSTQTDVFLINIDIQKTTDRAPVIPVNNTRSESFITKYFLNMMDPGNSKSEILLAPTERPTYVVLNRGLVLHESSVRKISTLQLSVTNQDGAPRDLVYRITKQTQLGHLEHTTSPGTRIRSFTQADLASGSIQYVHTSEEERPSDSFTFTVSDGVNEISQTFHISMRPVGDSLPILQVLGMSVSQGMRKTLSETELKVTDADSEEGSIIFSITQTPRHGSIQKVTNGYSRVDAFTMEDIYHSRISYQHDGSNSLTDQFSFTVTDGTNLLFMLEEGEEEIVTAAPQKFKIDILPVDDGIPRIVINLGLQWLEYIDNKATNLISKEELLTMDTDTEDGFLVYEVTVGPKHGNLETRLKPGTPISTFTQADINQRLIRYVLDEENSQETMDNFKFLVKDDKPNVVTDVFHIQWSFISFEHTSYNVSEEAGTVIVRMKRTGSLKHHATVQCHTEQDTATSSSSSSSRPGQWDYVEYTRQVQFDENEDSKMCTIVINDDQVFENTESFILELSMPVHTLLGLVAHAEVNIFDPEDEPTLQFDNTIYHVKESAGILLVPIERKGDTSAMVSVLCYTVPKSAQGSSLLSSEAGSDFYTRGASGESRVEFGPGSRVSTCDVSLIDDSEYEPSEEFELVLSDPSDNARIGDVAVASVVIDGPNDASAVFLGSASFTYKEDAGTIEIPVLRQGSDLSSVSSVWCATRPSDPPSATPGVDYIPSSKKVEFKPGMTAETCSLTIVDDIHSPTIEGMESFVVFLSSAQGALLTEPFEASVIITDTSLDIPSMQFEKKMYSAKENVGVLHIPIIRTGDLTLSSSVRCYTQAMSGTMVEDFVERRNTDDSRINFNMGEVIKNCTIQINDDSVFEPEEEFQVHLGTPRGDHWSGAVVGKNDVTTVIITNDEDAPTIEFEKAKYKVREPQGAEGIEVLSIKVIRRGDRNRTSKVRCSTRDGSAQSGVDYNPKNRVLKFSPGMDHILFKVEILSNEMRGWHESFSLVLGPDEPVDAVLGEITMATVTIMDQEAAGIRVLPAPPIVVSLSDYDYVEEASNEGSKKSPSPGYPLVCVTPCDPHYPKYSMLRARCEGAGINQSSVRFGWEVAAPTDTSGARSPFEMLTDITPFTRVNHKVLDSIYFSRRFCVRCVAQAPDKAGHLGPPLRSNTVTIGSEASICHTPIATGTTRGFQAQSFTATLKYLDVKHKEHPNRIHISVQIPHQDGMLPLVSTMPLQNLHFLLSESVYQQQHICSNLVTLKDLQGISESGFLDNVPFDGLSLGPGYDRPYQFTPGVREPRTIQLYKHLNLKSCLWTFDAYYDMTKLIDVCGGSVTADFQVRDSAQSFLTVQVPLYVSYIYVTAPRGWASLEHHTEMEFSFFYDTVLWRTGIQTDSVLSARLQISRIYIREDGRLVVEFKTHAKFRGQFVPDHNTLPGHKSHLVAPDHLGGMEFDLQLLWSAPTFDTPVQLWKATSSYSRKDYSGEYTVFLVPCTVQPAQPWINPGDKPLSCTAHTPEKFLVPIAFQQTNRPVPVVYSLNTEFQLCNNEKAFLLDPVSAHMSMAEMDYKGTFSIGQTLYGRVLWNPEQNLNRAYKLHLEKVYLCTGRNGYVPFFDPTGTLYNEGPQYGCIQPNKNLRHRFLLLDRKQPEVCDRYFHDVPFEASFASDNADLQPMTLMPGVDGFTMKVDALYKVEAGHQWYLQVIYVIGPEFTSGPSTQRWPRRSHRDLADRTERLVLDESLIYDNEGDQVKNGTNMKTLKLEVESEATFDPHTGGSIGGGIAALVVVLVVLLATCFLFKKCRMKKRSPTYLVEEYPLNTKVEVCLEKNFSSMHCTVRKVNVLNMNQRASKVKVKQVNLEVKLHNNFSEGTEV